MNLLIGTQNFKKVLLLLPTDNCLLKQNSSLFNFNSESFPTIFVGLLFFIRHFWRKIISKTFIRPQTVHPFHVPANHTVHRRNSWVSSLKDHGQETITTRAASLL